MQTLLLGLDKTLANLTFNIYRLIVDAYNLLVNFAEEINRFDYTNIVDTIRNNIYILLGIFMLFRLAISFINYMINPDAMGDKKSGTGKLITRIVMSFILLLALPLVFPLLRDLQSAIISPSDGSKGLIDRIVDITTLDYNAKNDPLVLDNLLYIDKVSALEGKECDYKFTLVNSNGWRHIEDNITGCRYSETKLANALTDLYLNITKDNDNYDPNFKLVACSNTRTSNCYNVNITEQADNNYNEDGIVLFTAFTDAGGYNSSNYTFNVNITISKSHANTLNCYYRMDSINTTNVYNSSTGKTEEKTTYHCGSSFVYVNYNTSGNGTPLKYTNFWGKNNDSKWYANSTTQTLNGQLYKNLSGDLIMKYGSGNDIINDLNSGICPKHIDNVVCNDSTCVAATGKKLTLTRKNTNESGGTALVGGVSSYDEFLKKQNECVNNNHYSNGEKIDTGTDDNVSEDTKKDLDNQKDSDLNNSCPEPGCSFARALLGAYMYGKDGTEVKEIFNEWPSNSNDISTNIDNGTYKYQTVISLIVGLALLFFLVAMVVELIIRNFKLFILEAISPIPVVCYMNPDDKTFDTWVKQYVGVYLDIFIKLLAISIARILLQYVIGGLYQFSTFETILYVIAVVLFMKVIPDFISKIFGVKNMGGSMKQTFGMLKSAAFGAVGGVIGAGAAIGAGVPNMIHAGKVSGGSVFGAALQTGASTVSAALKGIGSGSKGNVFGSANTAIASSKKRDEFYRSGIGFGTQLGAATLGLIGLDYASKKDRQIESIQSDNKNLERARKYKDNIQNVALNSSNFGNDVLGRTDENGNHIYDMDTRKKAAQAWASANYEVKTGSTNYNKYLNNLSANGYRHDANNNWFDASGESVNVKNMYVQDALRDKGIMDEDMSKIKYEEGKASQITSEVTDAASFVSLAIDNVTRDSSGKKVSINSVDDVYKLETAATKQWTANSNAITAATVNDPKYVAADAARKARSGKK